MNFTRLALAALAAFVAYFVVGGIGFVAVPGLKAEFEKHAAIMRPRDAMNAAMPISMFGTLIAVAAATAIFARMHPAGAGILAGLKFGAALAAFVVGGFVMHNHMLFNVSRRLSMQQAIGFAAEWIAVGIVISLVYRG